MRRTCWVGKSTSVCSQPAQLAYFVVSTTVTDAILPKLQVQNFHEKTTAPTRALVLVMHSRPSSFFLATSYSRDRVHALKWVHCGPAIKIISYLKSEREMLGVLPMRSLVVLLTLYGNKFKREPVVGPLKLYFFLKLASIKG